MIRKLLILLLLICTMGIYAQNNKNAIGLRFSYGVGITGKHYLNKNSAIEGVAQFGTNWFALTALYQKYLNLRSNLNLFYGIGGHFETWHRYVHYGTIYKIPDNGVGIGIAPTAGFCYNFPDFPIDISIDYTPIIQIVPYDLIYTNLGLSARYTF